MGCRLWVSRKNLKITVKTQSSSQCTQDKRPKRRNRSFSLKRLWDNHKFDLKRFMEECVMSEIIVVTSGKGGVGKTTTAVNLGVSLVQQGKKVLLIDADAQANLTMALGYNRPDDIPITLSTVMQNIIDDKTLDVSQGIIHHREGVDLLPSNIELSGFEVRLINAMSRERVKVWK